MSGLPVYMILHDQSLAGLERLVGEWMLKGYLPLGGPVQNFPEGIPHHCWLQAVYLPLNRLVRDERPR